MTTIEEQLVLAIHIRDRVAAGTESQSWVRTKVLELVADGFWNDPQIGAICGYSRQQVGKMAREASAVRPSERPAGGRLAPEVLDLLLELRGSTSQGSEPNALKVLKAVRTGTSTRLIARLTGVPIGVILYQQRKDRREEEVAAWLSQSTEASSR